MMPRTRRARAPDAPPSSRFLIEYWRRWGERDVADAGRGLRRSRSGGQEAAHQTAEQLGFGAAAVVEIAGMASAAAVTGRTAVRPAHEIRRRHVSFSHKAGGWAKPRQDVAEVEWHPADRIPYAG